jgi:hypothetical protein
LQRLTFFLKQGSAKADKKLNQQKGPLRAAAADMLGWGHNGSPAGQGRMS